MLPLSPPPLQEMMDESLARLAAAAGWPDTELYAAAAGVEHGSDGKRSNASPHARVPVAVRQAIEKLNDLDMPVYQHALQLFLHNQP